MTLKTLKIYPESCLFLDRDGVINKRIIDGYVTHPDEFIFEEKSLDAISIFSKMFTYIVVVTNQQGIGKGIFTEAELENVHQKMLNEVTNSNGRIDAIFYAPYLSQENHIDRKPNIGMALKAKEKFKSIDFSKSILVGDSISDMQMGRKIGSFNVFISENPSIEKNLFDASFNSLYEFSKELLINFEKNKS